MYKLEAFAYDSANSGILKDGTDGLFIYGSDDDNRIVFSDYRDVLEFIYVGCSSNNDKNVDAQKLYNILNKYNNNIFFHDEVTEISFCIMCQQILSEDIRFCDSQEVLDLEDKLYGFMVNAGDRESIRIIKDFKDSPIVVSFLLINKLNNYDIIFDNINYDKEEFENSDNLDFEKISNLEKLDTELLYGLCKYMYYIEKYLPRLYDEFGLNTIKSLFRPVDYKDILSFENGKNIGNERPDDILISSIDNYKLIDEYEDEEEIIAISRL